MNNLCPICSGEVVEDKNHWLCCLMCGWNVYVWEEINY